MGTVPERARLGHGPRGLQRYRRRPGSTSPTTTRAAEPTAGTRTGWPGICNRHQNVCLAMALWNERDPILKERLFGVSGDEGNHGEDVKEYYFYLDGTPTHSYMKMLYKYPQVEYPVRATGRGEPAPRPRPSRSSSCVDAIGEALRQGATSTCSSSTPRPTQEDILCRITCGQSRAGAAPLHVLPHAVVPQHLVVGLRAGRAGARGGPGRTCRRDPPARAAPRRALLVRRRDRRTCGRGPAVHRERDEHRAAVRRSESRSATSRTASTRRSSHGRLDRVNATVRGTKAAAHFAADAAARRRAGACASASPTRALDAPFDDFDAHRSRRESAKPTSSTRPCSPAPVRRPARVQRQAFAGSAVEQAVLSLRRRAVARRATRPARRRPPQRRHGRNADWAHLLQPRRPVDAGQVGVSLVRRLGLGVPPLPLALVDPEWAKRQLRAADARVVHAPERPAPGLRVGLSAT